MQLAGWLAGPGQLLQLRELPELTPALTHKINKNLPRSDANVALDSHGAHRVDLLVGLANGRRYFIPWTFDCSSSAVQRVLESTVTNHFHDPCHVLRDGRRGGANLLVSLCVPRRQRPGQIRILWHVLWLSKWKINLRESSKRQLDSVV